ncbi:MAG: hypothetical protein ABUL65_03645, partial [Opitutus sp.]
AEGGRHALETDNHGIGLNATRVRLEQAYGADHRMEFRLGGGEQSSIITIDLPLRLAPAPPAPAS